MLRIAQIVGVVLVSMLALSGVASGHNFKSSVGGNLKVVTNQNQLFTLSPSGDMVTCTKVSIVKGAAAAGTQLSILEEYEYTGCTLESNGINLPATASLVQVVYGADDALERVENTWVITIPVASCHITVKPQDRKAVLYKNSGKHIVIEPHVSGIVSEGSGGACGTSSKTGTFTGNTEVEAASGTIEWV